MPVIDSLIAELGFDFDDADLEKFNKGFDDAGKLLTGFIAGAAAVQVAISAFTAKFAEANDETGKFAERTGIAIETLQELGFVAELNGGSIDSMNSSLANLSRTAAESAKGMGANVETFGMLGVAVTDTEGNIKGAADLLDDVSDAIARLDTQAERLEFAQKLGIGEDLLLAIQDGSDALARQRKEARELGFVIDKDAAQAAADFNDNMLRMMKIIQGVSSAIATKFMKNAKPMVDLLIDLFKANKDLIEQNLTVFLEKVSSASAVVFNILARVWKIVDTLVQGFGGWKNAIMIVVGAMAILNASTLLIPALVIAAGAAILLMLEDVQKFAEGGDSALGDLINRFPALEKPVRILLDLIGMIGEGWRLIFTHGDEALEGLIMMIKDVGASIKDFILAPINNAIALLNKIPGVDISGFSQSNFAQGVGQQGSVLGQAGGGTTNNRTSNNKTTIHINGGNPAEVEATVKRVINDEYRGAETDLSTPVEM